MEKKKIIHFVIDDIFINDSIKCFTESGLTENAFYFVSNDKNYTLAFKNAAIQIISDDEALSLVKKDGFDALILHSLYALPPYILRAVNSKAKVIWFAWGYDIYTNYFPYKPLVPIKTYKKLTHNANCRLDLKKEKTRITEPLKRIIYREKFSNKIIKSALSRIDLFGGVFEEEYDLLNNNVPCFRAKRIRHNYIHPEEFELKELECIQRYEGDNILLGNSAGATNNHIDVMYLLHKAIGGKSNGIKIICPLSYGGKKDYIDKVIKTGRNLFGDSFVPLTSFLPLDEYNSLVQSCSSVLMGHLRQAAVGNCLTSMWMGLKLFMYEDSMNYQHYSKEGLTIFSLDTDLSGECLKQRLPDNDILKNRSFIESHHSYRIWKDNLRKLISEI